VEKDDPNYQPDYDRQMELLNHYKGRGTKIIFWDLDHKLPLEEEFIWNPDAVFETSVVPKYSDSESKLYISPRVRVEPPIIVDQIMQFSTLPCDKTRKLVYIGSRYERDDVIDEWIKPVSDRFPGEVEFWGNWLREPSLTECKKMWPNISYNERITMSRFRDVYADAVACPILAKKSYLETGFITPRPWEALMFGTIPVGLCTHTGVDDYVSFVARDSNDLCEITEYLAHIDIKERDAIRRANVEKIRFMDVKHFVDRIEEVL
jgi:hypothetical protein